MAETREILFKLTASEVEIQKSLEKVSKSLIDARTELKQLNQSFNLATKTIADYENELGQLNKQVSNNEITQEDYNKAVEELNLDLKTAQNTVQDYTKSQVKLKKEIQKLSTEQRGYIKDLQNLEKVTDKAEGSNEQLRASVSLLTKEYNKLSREERETSARGQLLTKTLREQTDALKENEKAVGDNRRNVGNYQDAFSGLTGGITDTIGSLAGPGGLVAGIGLAANLLKDGVIAVIEITKEFTTFRGEIQKLTGETGPALDELTAKIVSISRVFDEDFNEILLASNALSKELGITAFEAASLIEKGFLAGGNASGELLDILKEYGPQLSAVGIEAEQAIAIITQQVKQGVFSDKGIDAIKEASEKIAEFKKPAREALAALGIKNIEGLPIFEVIKLASEEISKLPEGSKEATKAIDGIFGTPGLDAGFKQIALFKDVSGSIDDLIDDSNTLTRIQIQQLESAEKLADAQNRLSKEFAGSGESFSRVGDTLKRWGIEIAIAIGKIGKLGTATGRTELLVSLFTDEVERSVLTIEKLQEAVDKLELPEPVPPDFSGLKAARDKLAKEEEEARKEKEKAEEGARKKKERGERELSRKLKIIDQSRLKDEIAGIQLRLLEVAKGSLEELNIRKNLLQKQSELTLTTRQLTANEELLIIKKTDEKKIDESKAFAEVQLQLSVNGLKGIQGALQRRFNEELALEAEAVANAKLTTEAIVVTKKQGQEQISQDSKETLEAITLNEQLSALQTQEFSSQTLRAQIKDLKELLENEQLTAEERKQIEAQLQATKLEESARVLQSISQLTGAFTTFFAAQKEKQLEAAAGNAEKEAEINEKFAKREKRLAIFESIINTGVAVVKALPNIPLSILVGTIGAIQTAAIASQSFAGGGFTGLGLQDDPNERGRKIAGVVHDNEYVIPTSVLNTPRGMGLALEAEKMRGFAGGGFTTPPTFSDGGIGVTQANETNATAELGKLFKQAVASLPVPVVNVNEVTDLQNRIKVKEATGF